MSSTLWVPKKTSVSELSSQLSRNQTEEIAKNKIKISNEMILRLRHKREGFFC